jgi:antitoxin CptB
MSELSRIRWRCRRGLLELDIVLGRFVDVHYSTLTDQDKDAFAWLLAQGDNELWDLISGQSEIAGMAPSHDHVLELLRTC